MSCQEIMEIISAALILIIICRIKNILTVNTGILSGDVFFSIRMNEASGLKKSNFRSEFRYRKRSDLFYA